jgi:AcrR family transcriptional regulator
MGNREALLESAKRNLTERGYAHITARDLAGGAGTSLAAIGYHFGSTEALLNEALYELIGEWGDQLGRTLTADLARAKTPLARFEAYWKRVIESFQAERPLWVASIDIMAQANRMPELARRLAEGIDAGRLEWARVLYGIDPEREPAKARQIGSVYQALLSGLLVQWLVDPEAAPSAADLASGMRAIAEQMTQPPT